MTYADAISHRLLQICKERNITVNKLSILSGISHTTIQDLVSGRTKNVKLKTLHKIAVGLDMTVSQLLDFQEMNETIFEDE
ncbi:transcriptional regulator [Lachnoclostridium sp. An298]|nr:transcriptional regulator [Lachnoclostridium sp. An298]